MNYNILIKLMEIIYTHSSLTHNSQEKFAEGPYRVKGIDQAGKIKEINFDVISFIEKIHPKKYIQKIRGSCLSKMPVAEVETSEETFKAAIDSVGLAIIAARDLDFAVTRPPGHHAGKEIAAGFCFFNNITIATQYLVDLGKKVCIIDIDGHHGDGTERIFYSDPNVLYCSVHQHNAYPLNSGNITNIGSGKGRGLNINLPVPENSGDDILIKALKFIRKYVDMFKPDIIGVSAGFDGYYEDRLLNLNYSIRGYYEAGNELSRWNYSIFSVLEGGYHTKLIDCIVAFVHGISKENITLGTTTVSDMKLHKLLDNNISRLEQMLKK